MTTKKTILRNLGIAVVAAGLVACNGAESRKAKYTEEGKKLFLEGDYEKAGLAFKNVLQIDPKDWENHYQMAEVFSKEGKIEQAFNEYRLVAAQDENHVMARVRVGQLLLLNRNADAAEKMVDEALAKQPDNVEALVLKAGVQSAKNDNDAAISTVDKALQLKPDDVSATLMQASIQARLGRTDKSVQVLKDAIEKQPKSVPLRSMLAGLYTRNNQLAEAEAVLQDILKVDPQQFQNYKTLAMFQMAGKQTDKAEATLREAVQNIPDSDIAKTTLVEFLVEKRSPDIAIAEILPMIEKNPEDYNLKFKLANVQLAKKDVPAAEATFKEVIEQNKLGPSGISARDKLAALYALTKRPDEAKALIKEVLEANPRDSESLTLRGQFALAENQIPEAIADFRSVLVDQPNNVNVLKMLATAHLRNNEDTLARENIEKVVAATPNDEAARLDLASLMLKAGQKEQAQLQVDTLLKNNPKSVRGLEAQFKIYLTEKQWDKAQAIAKKVQELNEKDPTGFYMAGLGQQAANKLEAAIEAFEKALSKKPDAIEPLNELIKTYMALKQPDKALAKLQQIVKQQPDNVIAYNLIGGIDLSQQKFPEAKAAFNKALDIKPDWFGPYRSLALIAMQEKNKAEAINILKKGIEKTKGVLELVVDLARIYHSSGEHDKVIALYEESYNAHPDSVMAINNLASYLSDYAPTSPNLARAAKMTESFSKSNNASLVDTVGWVAYKQGDYVKAKDSLLKAVELQPNALVSHYHLGMTYFKQNDKTKAVEELQKVVDAKVGFDGLETAKETLKTIQSGA